MELDYQCSISDYREAMFSHMRRPLGSSLAVLWGVIFLIIAITTVATRGWSGLAILVLISGLFCVLPLAFRVWQRFWVERDFRNHPGFAEKVHLSVDGEELRTEGQLGRREEKWAAFTKYRETENLFVLYEGARLLRVFPKRAFASEQLREFRDLLASKITPSQAK